ncbi:MAG: DUF4304 domain-containing protein [Lachnospiraceae bacterium]|nr:DUF4304 domain-containing protein [Lachnospiraceae bacterium]
MSQSTKMNAALKKYVLQPLIDDGFTGKYPHYRKVYENRIELLSIQKNKYGNSFTIEISTIFPKQKDRKKNFNDHGEGLDEINVWDTNLRYRLPGTINGWFYYTDVYTCTYKIKGRKFVDYLDISETKKRDFQPPENYEQIQQADDTIYEKVCFDVNKQMEKAFEWWGKMSKKA